MSEDSQQHPDHLIPMGDCPDSAGMKHAIAVKDGRPVGIHHVRECHDGEPLPHGQDLYFVDRKTGRVVDHMKIDGPAQVATDRYRNGWDAIFGKPPEAN